MEFTKVKVIVINIAVTAVEGFLAAWEVSGNKLDKATLVGAISAGLSAAWNLAVKPFLKSNTGLYK